MFFRSKKKVTAKSNIVLGMIMLRDSSPFHAGLLLDDLEKTCPYKVGKPSGDGAAAAFTIDGEMVAIALMPVPIPNGDIEGTAQYAYNWLNVLEDVKDHKAHLIVSVVQGSDDPIKRFRIFTSVICSLLRTNNAIGVYIGGQSLLISKDDYLDQGDAMSDEWLPLNLWIYFGLRRKGEKSSGYPYGLKEFNKREMEIVESDKSLGEIRELASSWSAGKK